MPANKEFVLAARALVATGASRRDVLDMLAAKGAGAIDAIKVIREVYGGTNFEAKEAIDAHPKWTGMNFMKGPALDEFLDQARDAGMAVTDDGKQWSVALDLGRPADQSNVRLRLRATEGTIVLRERKPDWWQVGNCSRNGRDLPPASLEGESGTGALAEVFLADRFGHCDSRANAPCSRHTILQG